MSLLSLLFQEPLLFLAIILVFLFALSVHEFSHAYAGYLLGDMTAKRMNRLTLNPLAHVDPLGFLALITVGFGWGKPVPFNPFNLKYPRWGPVIIAAAGPLANLILGTFSALLYRCLLPGLGEGNLLMIFLSYSAYLNYLLMIFNLIPVPPLDGSKALLAVLAAPEYQSTREFIETKGPLILIALILIDSFLPFSVFAWIGHWATSLVDLMAS